MPLHAGGSSPYPTDEDVLKRILAAVRKRPAWCPETGSVTQIA